VVLIIYVDADFYVFTNLAELEIPTDYDELDKIFKVACILLQIKISNTLSNTTYVNFMDILHSFFM